MEERGIDRRVRKTKRQLRQALMDLMSEKPSKSISVRELAERADINRGTFYIHYKDVSDLLQRLEDEMAERLILVCKKYAYSTGGAVSLRPGQRRFVFGAAGAQRRSGVYRAYLRHPTQLFPA